MTEYYVAEGGNDSGPGTIDDPWATTGQVTYAMINGPITTGDKIYFNRGDTFTGILLIRRGGTSSNELVIGAYGTGAKPILTNPSNDIINTSVGGLGYVTVQDLTLQDSGNQGIMWYERTGHHDITFRNLDIINSAQNGMLLGRINGYLIENCNVGPSHNSGIAIIGSNTDPIRNGIIRNCVAHTVDGNDGFTLHFAGHTAHIGSNHILENCEAHHCHEQGFDIVSGDNIQLINCSAHDNGASSIVIGHVASNVTVDNFHSYDEGYSGIWILESVNTIIKNSRIMNWARIVHGTKTQVGIMISAGYSQYGGKVYNCTIQNTVVSGGMDGDTAIGIGTNSPGAGYVEGVTFIGNYINYDRTDRIITYANGHTPSNTQSVFTNNTWWRPSGNPEPFGNDNGTTFSFPDWQALYSTEVWGELACTNPHGTQGAIICGVSNYGQDPTHQYECQCVGGVCSWVDLGYSTSCDMPESCTNPDGSHGAIICGDPAYGQDPTHQYECIDGVWTDLGHSSICDLEEPCTDPSGTHGDIICGDPAHGQDPTHQYQCQDGVWIDLGYDPSCDTPPPPPPPTPSWIWILIGSGIISGIIISAIIIKKRR